MVISQGQMDQSIVVDYTGDVVFSETAPSLQQVQSLEQELLLDITEKSKLSIVNYSTNKTPGIYQSPSLFNTDAGSGQ